MSGSVRAHTDPDRVFYHWSPKSRRESIKRLGLVPGKLSRCGEWRPPFVCLSDDPSLAWNLSAGIGGFPGKDDVVVWDLWMVYAYDTDRFENIFDTYPDTGRQYVKEVRVYHRIYKRHVQYLASRRV